MTKIFLEQGQNLSKIAIKMHQAGCKLSIDIKEACVCIEEIMDDETYASFLSYIIEEYSIVKIEMDEVVKTQVKDVVEEIKVVNEEPSVKSVFPVEEYEKTPLLLQSLQKLDATLSWALRNNVNEKDLEHHLLSVRSTISMDFSKDSIMVPEIGDVCRIVFGKNLYREISGLVFCVVIAININESQIFVVPITKKSPDAIQTQSHIAFTKEQIQYDSDEYESGILILEKAKWVHLKRLKEIIGITKKDFFKEIQAQLPNCFSFGTKELIQEETKTETINNGLIEGALEAVDKEADMDTSIKKFLKDLDLTQEDLLLDIIRHALVVGRLNYENLICAIQDEQPDIKGQDIKELIQRLTVEFKQKDGISWKGWSFMNVIKSFVKKYNS